MCVRQTRVLEIYRQTEKTSSRVDSIWNTTLNVQPQLRLPVKTRLHCLQPQYEKTWASTLLCALLWSFWAACFSGCDVISCYLERLMKVSGYSYSSARTPRSPGSLPRWRLNKKTIIYIKEIIEMYSPYSQC